MDYKKKYLNYKQKYLSLKDALKEQLSFAQGNSIRQKYLSLKDALKEQLSFAQGNSIRQKYLNLRDTLKGGEEIDYGFNILNEPLKPCPILNGKDTGFYRNNYCVTGPNDSGTHVVSALMDDEFLEFTKSKGNDLITPSGSFPGLVKGDRWCLCVLRWKQAYEAGKAPKIFARSTSIEALRNVEKAILMKYAIDLK